MQSNSMQWLGTAAVIVSLAGGCASQQARTSESGGVPDVAPALAVERFLHAANANDLMTMARLFGTREGSILERDPRDQVEQRMYVLASALRHDDYTLVGKRIAPGRLGNAVRIIVRMRFGEREVPVPFTVVRGANGSWLIEQVGIERITARPVYPG